jgi:hypothetical protein
MEKAELSDLPKPKSTYLAKASNFMSEQRTSTPASLKDEGLFFETRSIVSKVSSTKKALLESLSLALLPKQFFVETLY